MPSVLVENRLCTTARAVSNRGIDQVGVVALELGGLEQALVHQPPGRQADDHEVGLGHPGGLRQPLDPAPDHIQLALELVLAAGAALDEQLAHDRLAGAGQLADGARIDRHVAEAQGAMALLGADPHTQLLAAQPQRRVARQEHEPRAVSAGLGQPAEQRLGLAPQKPVGQLHHDSGAVAGLGIGAGGAAMLEAPQCPGGALKQLVRLATVQPDERAEAARCVLESRDPRGVESFSRAGASTQPTTAQTVWIVSILLLKLLIQAEVRPNVSDIT